MGEDADARIAGAGKLGDISEEDGLAEAAGGDNKNRFVSSGESGADVRNDDFLAGAEDHTAGTHRALQSGRSSITPPSIV